MGLSPAASDILHTSVRTEVGGHAHQLLPQQTFESSSHTQDSFAGWLLLQHQLQSCLPGASACRAMRTSQQQYIHTTPPDSSSTIAIHFFLPFAALGSSFPPFFLAPAAAPLSPAPPAPPFIAARAGVLSRQACRAASTSGETGWTCGIVSTGGARQSGNSRHGAARGAHALLLPKAPPP